MPRFFIFRMLRILTVVILCLCCTFTVSADCTVCPEDSPFLVSLPNPPTYSSNGCGPALVSGIVPDFDFKSCCDQHDFCYSFCNSTKTLCDNTFHTCMKTTCSAKGDKSDSFCDDIANLYFEALNNKLSCSIYKKSILDSCQCQATNSSTATSTSTPTQSSVATVPVSSSTTSTQSPPTVQPSGQLSFGVNLSLHNVLFALLLCMGWVL
ncbi:hypothetical protein K7432_006829 [Basidiobolus ranarum]|uniref:Uncharacterized protein n=1 Tax=Basidiobolus ranarum TaxID=34480 RepID=A0ABR2WUI3_9FUNG